MSATVKLSSKLPGDDDALTVRIKARFGIAEETLGGAA